MWLPGSCEEVLRGRKHHGPQGVVKKFLGQDFQELQLQSLSQGQLFNDEKFPITANSLGYYMLGPSSNFSKDITWKRPNEICFNPQFVVEDTSRFDFCQGELGNCWFLAALASLTLDDKLLSRVVPMDQSFDPNTGYAGIFHFQFWRFGEWVDVVVDDHLPTKNDDLVFVKSKESNEFWGALLEKAYAKLCGSYESVRGGNITEAFVDFTGGIKDIHMLSNMPSNMPSNTWDMIVKAMEAEALLGAQTYPGQSMEELSPVGLILGHSYSITAVGKVNLRGEPVSLVRLRNPWGKVEWNGSWSDRSLDWNYIDESSRNVLRGTQEDGEFWMSMDDFQRHFKSLSLCHLNPAERLESRISGWTVQLHEGKWIRGSSAGGCRRHIETFWMNPEYQMVLLPNPNDVDLRSPCLCSLIVSLMQKPRDNQRNRQPYVSIGFYIYQISPETTAHLPSNFFMSEQPILFTPQFVNHREVSLRCQLPPGSYVIIPATFNSDEEAEFILRIFSQSSIDTREFDEEMHFSPFKPISKSDTTKDLIQEKKCEELFKKFATKDGDIDARKLQALLKKITEKHPEIEIPTIDFDACRQILVLMDKNCSGTMELEEFKEFWKRLVNWHVLFESADVDQSGMLDPQEARNVLRKAGLALSNEVHGLIIIRYGDENHCISFQDYICCMLRLESSIGIFSVLSPDTKEIHLTKKEWMKLTLYS
uniref:calpain-1 catalytic subunit-like n=1 Tax=Myxine glutinosa TaxID=7769 RepID=UPI00358F716C